MEQEVIINEANLKEIEAKLEDGRCYWASLNEGDGLEIIRFTSNKDAPAQCNDINYCWYDLHQYWSIIPTPITPPKPLPSDDFIEYIDNSRHDFVRKMNAMIPNVEQRVMAEDILICFDQMRENLLSLKKPLPSDAEIGQIFSNNTDCYADTWRQDWSNGGRMIEGRVIPAMTKEKFIEGAKAILNILKDGKE